MEEVGSMTPRSVAQSEKAATFQALIHLRDEGGDGEHEIEDAEVVLMDISAKVEAH